MKVRKVRDIRKGDIITYRNKTINYVNKEYNYWRWYDTSFRNITCGKSLDIVKIQRYVKFLWFYRLKTIYKRAKDN